MSDLPQGWEQVKLSHVSERITKGSTPTSYGFKYQDAGIAFVKVESIKNGRIDPHSIRHFISKEANLNQRRSILEAGDILFSIAGTIGATCLVQEGDLPANTNQALAIIRGTARVLDAVFLRYQLESEAAREQSQVLERGGGMNNISLADVGNLAVAVPPLNEQRRIVAKLEKLLSRVDTAQVRLATIPRILQRFRQSVLAAACSGRLTADSRTQQNGNKETVGGTLGEIEIPDSWVWKKLPELGFLGRGKSKHRPRDAAHLYGGDYPFIQTGNIARSNGFITEHNQTYNEVGLAQSKRWEAGTVCITIAANIADSAILTYPACFPDSVVGFIAHRDICLPKYVEFFIRTARSDLSQFAPATAQKNINLSILNKVLVPLPPLVEQQEIVRRVEALFKTADALEARYRNAKAHVDKLTQSILAKAFRGELVPQDPNDEPASDLLERIRRIKNDISRNRKAGKPDRSTGGRTAHRRSS